MEIEELEIEIEFKQTLARLIYLDVNHEKEDWLKKARSKLISRSTDIFSTFERLEDISIYIKSFPYENPKLSPARYLSYHWDNFHSEIYNLREYMIGLLNSIKKLYKNSELEEEIENGFSEFYEEIPKQMKKITDIRNKQVHEGRILGKDIAFLESLELMREDFSEDINEELYNKKLQMQMTMSSKVMLSFTRLIEAFSKVYFETISSLIISEEKDLIIPETAG